MILHMPTLLPLNWLKNVDDYDVVQIKNPTSQYIAKNIQQFIITKKEHIIGARFVQVFLDAVINKKSDIFSDFQNIPDFIIDEAFAEIKGEMGLRFCEKFDSLINELLAFQEVLTSEKFKPYQKPRADGQSDFFIKKYCLEYEAEVKFKMADQAFHNALSNLIMGHSMLSYAHCLIGKRINITIKLPANQINDHNKNRVYSKVDQWCKSHLNDFCDDDLDIKIENGNDGLLKIECGDNARLAKVPESYEVHMILKSHMEKIQSQFKKRNPKRSIGIIMWDTPWNYDSDEKDAIQQCIKEGVRCGLDSLGFVCDRLYIYPSKFKKPILFKQKKES